MKRSLLTFILCLAGLLPIWAQEINPPPFHSIDNFVRKNDTSWGDSRKEISELFQQERSRLKDRFEAELWKYIGEEHPLYFWAALFLDSPAYLHGRDASPELALAIRQKGLKLTPEPLEKRSSKKLIELNPNKPDVVPLLQNLKMLTFAAISSEKLGNYQAASLYKEEAETILSRNPDLKEYLPVLSEFNSCIYLQIGVGQKSCKEKEMMELAEGMILKPSVVNGKLLYLPLPRRPKSRLRGPVQVELVIDEQGKVISAKAISGWPDLFGAAEEAALRARYSPTTFYGRPLVVPGLITFKF